MTEIHPTALVDGDAALGENVKVGPFTIIEAGAQIGDGTEIGSNALITGGARIGNDCRVFNGAVIGTIPQDLKFNGEDSVLFVGDRTTVREFVTLNRGTSATGETRIGSDCLLMAYSHVAHDCVLGSSVILANAVNLAGHVEIGDRVNVGGMSAVHQFVKIGAHAFIGGGYRVTQDVPPYILASGEPLQFAGLNSIGLKRRGFSEETLHTLKQAYKMIYRAQLNVTQALDRIRADSQYAIPEIEQVITFVENSERGIIR